MSHHERRAGVVADQTMRIWNPATGRQRDALHGRDWVTAICPVTVNGQNLLARDPRGRFPYL